MAENYKHLYEQMKKIVAMYQDEVVPSMREQLEKRVEVVRCKDCKACTSFDDNGIGYCCEHGDYILENDFCSNGERKDD